MSKPSIMLVEDEPLIADDIAEILEKNGYRVVGIADEASDALAMVEEEQPDVALLDINIEGDRDGIQLAAELSIPFVFLTSYYDQATLERAARVNPSGYIVKPFNESDLLANIGLALRKHEPKPKKNRPPEKLFFRKEQEILSVMSDEIIYAEAFDNYTYLFTKTDKYIISHTLKSVEEKLSPLGFTRVHRSYLINFQQIDSISENNVFLGSHQVPVSKSFRKGLMDQLSMI
ncbi:MAG: response regulator [Cyclobacteriaceae bacterium]